MKRRKAHKRLFVNSSNIWNILGPFEREKSKQRKEQEINSGIWEYLKERSWKKEKEQKKERKQ